METVMATQAAAIYGFLSGFGIPVYAASSVPENAEFPYMTYTLITGSWENFAQAMTIDLWYRTTSEAEPNAKAEEMRRAIGRGGKMVQCDGGAMWIMRGSPWCQSMSDPADGMIKRRYINLDIEFLTTD